MKIKNEHDFDRFWIVYEKKVNKPAAVKAWNKVAEKEYNTIFEHAPEYVKSTPNKKFRKDPSTYLNGECWNDEIIEDKLPEQDKAKSTEPNEANRKIREALMKQQ